MRNKFQTNATVATISFNQGYRKIALSKMYGNLGKLNDIIF